jgi:hypothetical protein
MRWGEFHSEEFLARPWARLPAWFPARLPARLTGWLLGCAVLVATLGAMQPVHAAEIDEEIRRLRLDFVERGSELLVKRVAIGPLLFDQRAYRTLEQNPLATVVVVRFYVYRQGETRPVSYRLVTARIVYDLWLEEYEVRIDSGHGRRSGRYQDLAEAHRAITDFADLSVAELADIAVGPHYYLAVVAELNPVSEETMAEVRRWLTRPAGAARLDRETSFFGSFVSIFVNARLPEAERVIRARSQPFYRVRR